VSGDDGAFYGKRIPSVIDVTPRHPLPSPLRPLGPLSDFVVDELPHRLDAIRQQDSIGDRRALVEDLGNTLQPMISSALRLAGEAPFWRSDAEHRRNLAALDLKLARWSLARYGGPARMDVQSVEEVLRDICLQTHQDPRVLTYQELFLINGRLPDKDMRTMRTGSARTTEVAYIRSHLPIEEATRSAGSMVRDVIDMLIGSDVDDAIDVLKEAREVLRAAPKELQCLRKYLDVSSHQKHFESIVEDLRVDPVDGQVAGPCGRSSLSIPTLDLLLAGRWMGSEWYRSISDQRPTMPVEDYALWGQSSMLARGGSSLRDLLQRRENNPQLVDAARGLSNLFYGLRRTHWQAAMANDPEIASGRAMVDNKNAIGGLASRMRAPHFDADCPRPPEDATLRLLFRETQKRQPEAMESLTRSHL
jgi:hypothetical protein